MIDLYGMKHYQKYRFNIRQNLRDWTSEAFPFKKKRLVFSSILHIANKYMVRIADILARGYTRDRLQEER